MNDACKTRFALFSSPLLAAWAFACLGAAVCAAPALRPARQDASSAAKSAAAAPLVVVDETGRTVEIPQPVRRIVSLAPSITETVFALGAGDRLVGDTDYCDYPAAAQSKAKVGGVINPNLEEVVALRPDLVLATKSANRLETVDALARLRVPVYASFADTVEGVLASIERLGDVIGVPGEGRVLRESLEARLGVLDQKLKGVAPKRVLFIVWRDPLISVGRDTFLADALRRGGAESVINTRQDWPHVSLEEVVKLQPDYLILAAARIEEGDADFAALRDAPVWRNLTAVKQNHFVVVSDAINRPAARIVDAIEQLAHQLHPAAFESAAPQAGVPQGPTR